MDMNIVIRTAVVTPGAVHTGITRGTSETEWDISIGAGGAITALSDRDEEFEEMLLKARAVSEAVNLWSQTIR